MSEVFSGRPGKFVDLKESIDGFKALLEGEGDEYPENSFYMVGKLEEAFAEAKRIAAQSAKEK